MFNVQQVQPSIRQELRYPNNKALQEFWAEGVKEQIQIYNEEIEFFTAFSSRNIVNREAVERANDILETLRSKKQYLERCILKGDYLNDRAQSQI